MPSIIELDVVNAMLAGIGIAPKVSLDRPDRYTAMGIQALRRWSRQVQGRGWWFNDRLYPVVPDPLLDYRVDAQLPCNLIAVYGPLGVAVHYAEPGHLYGLDSGETITSPLTLRVIHEVPFAELPDSAQFYIQDCATVDFSGRMDGNRVDIDRAFLATSLVQLNAENIRQRKVSLLHSPTTATRLMRVNQSRPFGNR